jgi:hypothetical protein
MVASDGWFGRRWLVEEAEEEVEDAWDGWRCCGDVV